MDRIRVAIVDGDHLARRAMRALLRTADDITVVGEARDGISAVALVRDSTPDVALLNERIPRMDGAQTAAHIAESVPETRVLAVTGFDSLGGVLPMLRAGATGYLTKDVEPAAIIAAVRFVHAGGVALSPAVAAHLMEPIRTESFAVMQEFPRGHRLSARERQVLTQLARGISNAEIGEILHLSESTVKTHVSSIIRKWRVENRLQVLIRAARAGLVRFR